MENTAVNVVDSFSLFKMFISLGFVLGLILVSAWLLRRWQGARVSGTGSGGLAVLTSLPIGDRKYLMVVAVGEKSFLVGVTPQSISMLGEVDFSTPTAPPAGEDFAGLLRRAWPRAKKKE